MAKVVTLGELMLRLSPTNNERFVQTHQFSILPGGGEANVAVSCAILGHDVYYVTKLPSHEIGTLALNALRSYGVNTQCIARGGERVGLYYAETGSAFRASKVIYDRAQSAIAQANVEDFDFDTIMHDADWFHWTGITPALSPQAARIVLQACQTAKKYGVKISVDLNYRNKLWTSQQAIQTMRPLMQYVDVCIGNEEDAAKCLGYTVNADIQGGETQHKHYEPLLKQMMQDFGFQLVVTTLRESFSATHNGWKALLYDGQKMYYSQYYDINPITDRIGAGDAFAAGLIHGLLSQMPLQTALDFGVAASALKHTIVGDFNLSSQQEILALMNGNTNGRVQR